MAVHEETILLKDEVSKGAAAAGGAIGKLVHGLIEAHGALERVATGQQTFGEMLTANGAALSRMGFAAASAVATAFAASIAAVVAGLGAMAAGLAAITVKAALFAIETSEAKEASLALWDALGNGETTGEKIDEMLDGLRIKTGIAKDTLQPLAEGFLRMGITGEEALQRLTIAAASAEATVKGGGAAFTELFRKIDSAAERGKGVDIPFKKLDEQLVAMGLTSKELASKLGVPFDQFESKLKAGQIDAKKFGDALQTAITDKGKGPLDRMALSSSNLFKNLSGYWGDLFEDFGKDFAPLLKEVSSLFEILDSKTKPSGQALKAGLGGALKEVFDLAAKLVPMVKHFLLDVGIYALRAYIALKPTIAAFKEWTNSEAAAAVLNGTLVAVGAALATVAAAAAVVGAGIALVIGTFISFGTAAYTLYEAVTSVVGMVRDTLGGWVESANSIASDFIDGLVNGITEGTLRVVSAVTSLGNAAVDGIKSALQINSPSLVGQQIGGFFGEGTAMGIEGSAGDVAGAAGSLGAAAATGAASAKPDGASAGGGMVVNVEPGAIVIQGAGGSAAELTEAAVSLLFERVALAQGLA